MINLNFYSKYLEQAKEFFTQISGKISSLELTRPPILPLTRFSKESLSFIPKTSQIQSFVKDSNEIADPNAAQTSLDSQPLLPTLIKANQSNTPIETHFANCETLYGRLKKWVGVNGLHAGVENLRGGNYIKGFYEMAFGSIRLALTTYVTLFVAQQIIIVSKCAGTGNKSLLEIPGIEKSQIQSESFNGAKGDRKITLITAYDEGIKDYADYVIPNQRTFAAKWGYDYIEYYGNLAHDQGRQRAPYWSKIVAIHDQLLKGKEGEWIAWCDASALITNTNKNFDQIIQKYGSDKDLILTTDPQVPINNAVFLVKNTPWTKNWIQKVWERSDLAKPGEGNCWSWGLPFCHYEQQAMTELWERDEEVQSHTEVIPNKEMNAFYRYSHYDNYRDMYQDYDSDKEDSKWAVGDFMCKVTGMDRERRLQIIKHVASNCIDKKCEKIKP